MKKIIPLCGALMVAVLVSPAYAEEVKVGADSPVFLLTVLAMTLFVVSKLAKDYWHRLILSIAAALFAVVTAVTAFTATSTVGVLFLVVTNIIALGLVAIAAKTMSVAMVAEYKLESNNGAEDRSVFTVIFCTAMAVAATTVLTPLIF